MYNKILQSYVYVYSSSNQWRKGCKGVCTQVIVCSCHGFPVARLSLIRFKSPRVHLGPFTAASDVTMTKHDRLLTSPFLPKPFFNGGSLCAGRESLNSPAASPVK